MNFRHVISMLMATLAVAGVIVSSQRLAAASAAAARATAMAPTLMPESWESAPGAISPHVFTLALRATRCAVQSGALPVVPATLTVIDYSKPSSDARLWVFDLRSRAVLYRELVAHGQGSGDQLATRFSNDADSHRSSLGLFVTDDTYVGRNGYSLRLNGLEAGVNDRARERALVIHGAPYVSAAFVRQQGRLGRSWGCPALPAPVAREIIDRVKGGGVVFAYYPDRAWLGASRYLGDCSAA